MPLLFQPDRYSDPVPSFRPVPENDCAYILETIAPRYRKTLGRIDSIGQSGGHELNSNNFRLNGSLGRFLLKRTPAPYSVEEICRQSRLSTRLGDSSLPVPGLLDTDDGDGFVETGDSIWQV